MLSTLLLTFACAAPAQEPAAVVDSLPADTLFVAQMSLEPWDRLRKNTRAHGVLRGKNMLKSILSEGLETEKEVTEMRTSLGAIRVTMAATIESLGHGGMLMVIEPVNVGAAAQDWNQLLTDAMGFAPQRMGKSYLSFVGEDYGRDEEALQTFLQGVASGAAKSEGTLASNAAWQDLSSAIRSSNDLVRFYVPSGILATTEAWSALAALDIPLSDSEITMMVGLSKAMAFDRGMAWTMSIDGADVVDRMYFPRKPEDKTVYASVGNVKDAIDRIGKVRGENLLTSVYGLDYEALFALIDQVITAVAVMEGESDPMSDPTVQGVLTTLRACTQHLGPRLVGVQSIGDLASDSVIGSFEVQVKDRAKLVEAWGTLPEEIAAFVPFLVMSLGEGNPNPVQLFDDRLVINGPAADSEAPMLAQTDDFKMQRPELEAWAEGGPLLFLQVWPRSADQDVLSELSTVIEFLGMFSGTPMEAPEFAAGDLSKLRPGWVGAQRTARGIEVYGRSNFGLLTTFGLLGVLQEATMMGAEAAYDNFEEEEF